MLMAVIDRMHKKSEAEARAALIQSLVRTAHISLDDAARYLRRAFAEEVAEARATDADQAEEPSSRRI